MAHCTELTCGCIYHPLAGRIRQCGAFGARSMSGKSIKLEGGDTHKHNAAKIKHEYPVAPILP